MIKCNKCNVLVETGGRCPLCFLPLEESERSDVSYPSYSLYNKDKKSLVIKKIFIFASIVASLLCLTINMLTLGIKNRYWAVIVLVSIAFVWGLFLVYRTKNATSAGKTLLLYAFLSITLITIDIYSGFLRWSTSYVIPFLTIAMIMVITIFAVARKKRFREYLGFQLVSLIMSIFPMLMYILTLSDVLWTSISTLLYALFTVLGLYVFADNDFKREIAKRFHF